jgi:hypothetical protein
VSISDPFARLVAFAIVLAAVFGTGVAVGAVIGPDRSSIPASDMEMDHSDE